MLNIYKKGNNKWYDSVPTEPEATPYVPLWSSGDGYQTNNLFIYRASDQTTVTTGSYGAGQAPLIYNLAVEDSTGWYNTATGVWTPTVAGWWQINAGGYFGGGGQGAENVLSMAGAASAQADSVGGVWASITGVGYFNGVSSNVQIYVATVIATPCNNPQVPTTSYFQALFLRP